MAAALFLIHDSHICVSLKSADYLDLPPRLKNVVVVELTKIERAS